MPSRDDFSKSTKETLSKRVGNRCSNPECRKQTSGPHPDPAKALNVGVAGHITAASKGGARYDASLTPEQRRSPENGIWLCQNCGKLVDNDASTYTVAQLNEWKQQAEREALDQVKSNKVLSNLAQDVTGIPPGVQDLHGYWTSLSSIGEFHLDPSVFTASRESEVQSIGKWICGGPDSFFLQTVGLTEGIDFLAALSASNYESPLASALVVYTIDAWHQLSSRTDKSYLVAAPNLSLASSDIAEAVTAGHFVFVSGPRGIVAPERGESLRRQNHYMVGEALEKSGYSPSAASSLARGSCGSSSILKRLITRHPETIFPEWSQDDVRNTIAPFALIGGWIHVEPNRKEAHETPALIGAPTPIDVEVVRELVGCDQPTLDSHINRWRQGVEPLFVQLGNSVLVASREDAWHLLGSAISPEQLSRFVAFAELLLEENDPALELPPDQRWMANLRGKAHLISHELRKSLIETLALMGTYDCAGELDPRIKFPAIAEQIVAKILPKHATWERWASFGNSLTTIAEASPILFLARVEVDLASESPEIPKLFVQRSDPFFGRSLQCDLLWALETLAWSNLYLTRASIVLANLASVVPPPGNYTNHPQNSLREIFLYWLWHTNASREERLNALVEINRVQPLIGWRLILSLLPSGQTNISHNTAMPRWRPWAEGWSRERLKPEIIEYAKGIAALAIDLAAKEPDRWAEALNGLLRLNDQIRDLVFSSLVSIAQDKNQTDTQKFPLWNTLRELVEKLERYPDAPWVYPEAIRTQLATLRDQLEPADPLLKSTWLFEFQAELLKPSPAEDLEAHDKALHDMRKEALRQIISHAGIAGIFRLLERASNPDAIGWIIGYEELLKLEEMQIPKILTHDDQRCQVCGRAFIAGSYSREDMNFINRLPISEWSPVDVARVAACLPFDKKIWDWAEGLGSKTKLEYWRRPHRNLSSIVPADLERAARSLIEVGRPFTAIGVLHAGLHRNVELRIDLIAEVLESALFVESTEDPHVRQNVNYEIQQLVLALQQPETFDRMRLARIEWGFLPLLQREYSKATPDTLVEAITSNPEFFVEVLRKPFRGENEPDTDNAVTEDDRFAADRAYELLNNLETLPGTSTNGNVDIGYLEQWIDRARAVATESGHTRIFYHTLGEIIARATRRGVNENWPSAELASLMQGIEDDALFEGFISGVINSRGVTTRGPFDGGAQEHALAQECRRLAEVAQLSSSKLADSFMSLSAYYEQDARREDAEAQRIRIGR